MFPSRKNAQAKIIRRGSTPCLLGIFDASTPPMIWQFDLEKMANYGLSLREKDGEWDFGVALPQGTFTVVAHFDERNDAEAAYAAVRKALMKGERSKLHHGFRGGLLVLLLAIALFYFWPMTRTSTPEKLQQAQEQQTNAPQEIQPGIPMSADDVLTIPQD